MPSNSNADSASCRLPRFQCISILSGTRSWHTSYNKTLICQWPLITYPAVIKERQTAKYSLHVGCFLHSQNWPNVMCCMFHTSMHLLISTESHVMGPQTAQNNTVIRYLPCHKTHYIDADRPNLVTKWVRPVSRHQRLVLAQRNCGTRVYNLAK